MHQCPHCQKPCAAGTFLNGFCSTKCQQEYKLKTIRYAPDGQAFADASAEEQARSFLLSTAVHVISVSTDNFIEAARALVCEGVYNHKKLVLAFREQTFTLNKYGRIIEDLPYGFCDYHLNWLSRILQGSLNHQKEG